MAETLFFDSGLDRLTPAVVSAASSGDNTLVAAVTGKSLRIFKLVLVFAADVDVIFKSGSTALTGTISMKAGGSIVLDFDICPWFVTGAGEAFVMNLSGAQQVSGNLYSVAR